MDKHAFNTVHVSELISNLDMTFFLMGGESVSYDSEHQGYIGTKKKLWGKV